MINLLDAFAISDELEVHGLSGEITQSDAGYVVRAEVGSLSDLETIVEIAERRRLRCRIAGPPAIIEFS